MEVWKLPGPRKPSPGNHVRIGDEVAVPKVGMLSFSAARLDERLPVRESES